MMPTSWGCFMVTGAVVLSGITAAIISAHEPQSSPAAPAPVVKAGFADRWSDSTVNDWPLLKKQDRLALPLREPLPVKTETVLVLPQTEAQAEEPTRAWVAKPVSKPVPKRIKVAEHEGNVCTRHKMHLVWVTSRRWRCRR